MFLSVLFALIAVAGGLSFAFGPAKAALTLTALTCIAAVITSLATNKELVIAFLAYGGGILLICAAIGIAIGARFR